MKLIKKDANVRWIIVDEVTDDDAFVLRTCGFDYIYNVDENGCTQDCNVIYPYEMWWSICDTTRRITDGVETVEINSNEIRWLADGMDLLIKYVKETYHFEDKEDVLKMYNGLLEKIAKFF